MRAYLIYALTLCINLSTQTIFAQTPKQSPSDWGVISDEERDMTSCSFDPNTGAIVLLDYGEWKLKSSGKNLGYKAILQRHTRIKILNEDGLDWAEGALTYIDADKFEKVIRFDAQTINWDGNAFTYHKLEKEHILEEKLDDYSTKLNYVFPQVKIGSILEFTYEFMTSDILKLKPWYFQKDIPTLHSELRKGEHKGFDHVTILYGVEDVAKEENHWLMKDIPALTEEPFVNNLENYRARINFELKDYEKSFNTGYGIYKYKADLYKSWNDLNNDLMPALLILGNKEGFDKLKHITDSLIAQTPDTLERVKILYNFVRDSMEWNKEYALKARDANIAKVLAEGKGNSAEINGLLRKMLEFGGIRCAAIVLGTIDHRPPVFDYPVISQFNHNITIAQIGSKSYFLDATDPFRPYHLPDEDDLVAAGWLLQPGQGTWIPFENKYKARQQTFANLKIKNDDELSISVRSTYAGYYGVDMRHLIEDIEEQDFWEQIIQRNMETTDFHKQEIQNLEAADEPLKLAYECDVSGFVQNIGDFIYINPVEIFQSNKNPFLSPERKYNIEMGYLHHNLISISLAIPDGYEIESLPKAIKVGMPERAMSYLFNCEALGNIIQISSRFETNLATFPVEYYPALKQVYDHMIAKVGEQIVLKRK